MNCNNILYQPVYNGKVSRENFKEAWSSLGVSLKFTYRKRFQEKFYDNFLEKTSNNSYNIHLPKDLQNIELIRIIDALNKEFDIEKSRSFEELLIVTKVAVAKFLKDSGGEGKEKLKEYIEKSGISKELQQQIEDVCICENRGAVKSILKQNGQGYSFEQMITNMYKNQLQVTLFRQAIHMLGHQMMTFTQADAEALNSKENTEIHETVARDTLDRKEQKLWDVLDIDIWQERFTQLRESGQAEECAQKEYEFCEFFIKKMVQYPHQKNDMPLSVNRILENKEMHCVGYSVLSHAIFSRLGIEHYGICLPGHSTIGIIIGGEKYIFDVAHPKGFHQVDFTKLYYGAPEIILLSQIYFSKWGFLTQEYRSYEIREEVLDMIRLLDIQYADSILLGDEILYPDWHSIPDWYLW